MEVQQSIMFNQHKNMVEFENLDCTCGHKFELHEFALKGNMPCDWTDDGENYCPCVGFRLKGQRQVNWLKLIRGYEALF